jgi:hypothetical protein
MVDQLDIITSNDYLLFVYRAPQSRCIFEHCVESESGDKNGHAAGDHANNGRSMHVPRIKFTPFFSVDVDEMHTEESKLKCSTIFGFEFALRQKID